MTTVKERMREQDIVTCTGTEYDDLMDCKEQLSKIKALANEQAEDEGLWFIAITAPEAYLQHELRKLHRAIDDA